MMNGDSNALICDRRFCNIIVSVYCCQIFVVSQGWQVVNKFVREIFFI